MSCQRRVETCSAISPEERTRDSGVRPPGRVESSGRREQMAGRNSGWVKGSGAGFPREWRHPEKVLAVNPVASSARTGRDLRNPRLAPAGDSGCRLGLCGGTHHARASAAGSSPQPRSPEVSGRESRERRALSQSLGRRARLARPADPSARVCCAEAWEPPFWMLKLDSGVRLCRFQPGFRQVSVASSAPRVFVFLLALRPGFRSPWPGVQTTLRWHVKRKGG